MLDSVPQETLDSDTIRLVSYQHLAHYIRAELDLDQDESLELLEFLKERGFPTDASKIVDSSFALKPIDLRSPSRFSDGSFPVYYSAMEPQTAYSEVLHHFRKSLPNGFEPLRAHCRQLICKFSGSVVDLRSSVATIPALTEDSGYQVCNDLGREAVARLLDGFLAPSARKLGGTCVPVFARTALTDARFADDVELHI